MWGKGRVVIPKHVGDLQRTTMFHFSLDHLVCVQNNYSKKALAGEPRENKKIQDNYAFKRLL